MRVSQPENSAADDERRTWEPPALVEMKIGTETKSSRDPEDAALSKEPPQPAAPVSKLGFYFEWGFPLSSRVTK
ncbi:MAG: hypothetical protein WB760_21025 [Xanthobacteraceae bacterium]